MDTEQDHIKTLTEIRTMMEKSSRFMSLSGLSGVFAGIFALLGAAGAFMYLNMGIFSPDYYERGYLGSSLNLDFLTFFFTDAMTVLLLAVTFGILFTVRNSRKKGVPIWGTMARLTVINLFIPLIIGGLFCLILLYHHLIFLIAPATLLFYGLALFNAGKYTLIEVRYLGITEMLLGLVACLFAGYGLLFWALGFGVFHITYGSVMYFKYERS